MLSLDSQTLRDALRLGCQSAVAASLCYMIINLVGSEEAFVGVLSAVLIVQPSIGRTISAGWERLLSTVVGCSVGLLCLFLLPQGYGVAIVLAILMFIMNFIAGFRPEWRYGVVAVVALALADTSGNIDVAQARSVAIGIGIAVGIGVSFIVWPESASKRGLRHRRMALDAISNRFKAAMKDEEDSDLRDQSRRQFHRALSSGREVIGKAKTTDTGRLKRTFDAVEELYNSVILIDRIDRPLSYFEGRGPDQSDIVQLGCAAIESLKADKNKPSDAIQEFSDLIDAVEETLADHDIQDSTGTHAASVIFGLKEMKRCLNKFAKHNERRKGDQSPLEKLSPA